jgi:hypothetical protein
MKLSNKTTNILAGFLLIVMALLGYFSVKNDSATMDELAHIPAGYSYVAQKDMRLNPEHPPLLKDLAGLSVWLGAKINGRAINFPAEHKSWQEDINGQWDFGRTFLYQSGNDADQIIFWARLSLLLIMLVLGVYIFKWSRELYGNRAALLALFLYSLSPNFLAHGRLVTTDVGAAAAFFIAIYYLVKWLKTPSKKNLVIAGLVLGLALLTKFSLVLLIPFFVLLTIVWSLIEKPRKMSFGGIESRAGTVPRRTAGRASDSQQRKSTLGIFAVAERHLPRFLVNSAKYLLCLLLIGLIAMALIWPIYQFHVLNYPVERQKADTEFILNSFGKRYLADPIVWMTDKPILRPYGQFFLGILMVIQRAVGGNTTFFLGEISASGWKYYFPIVFLIKTPLPLLILILVSLLFTLHQIKRYSAKKIWSRFARWLKNNFAQFALVSFFIFYWITTLRSNLNIGLRHILPTFPIIYVLISGKISQWLKISFWPVLEKLGRSGLKEAFKDTIFLGLKTYFKYLILLILLGWYAFGTIKIYPHFLAYFNELAGGAENGYKYVADSNLDWGQDMKRLVNFVKNNNIQTIYLDYFGGASAEYYLGDRFQPWWSDRDPKELPPNSWLAVSATLLQGGRGRPVSGFDQKTGYYNWLNQYKPVEIIGHSIFVYQIP